MSQTARRILVVDDDEQIRFVLGQALGRWQYGAKLVGSAEEALGTLKQERYDLILLDVRLPQKSGIDALEEILHVDQWMPVIIITAHGTREMAVEAIKRGAYDFFTKPFRLDEMEIVIRRALERRRLLDEIQQLRTELGRRQGAGRLVVGSPAMQEVVRLIERLGDTDSTGLIVGESGTGKELVAEALHERSPRRDRPFVKLNCAAIPETLLESELFGFERGAFTGAVARKPGKFEQAHGGTLLLDEIGDMTLATQAKILRVLQEREFERLGGTASLRVDVRILASTNKDLARAVEEGRFRDDLYFRLNVITLQIPPLRDRKEEIPLLVDHFLADINSRFKRTILRLTPEAMAALMDYRWPGNVRELRNCLERAAIVTDGETIGLEALPPPIGVAAAAGVAQARDGELSLDERMLRFERTFLLDALARAGGVQASAARLLGVSERSVWHLVKKHRIQVEKLKIDADRQRPR